MKARSSAIWLYKALHDVNYRLKCSDFKTSDYKVQVIDQHLESLPSGEKPATLAQLKSMWEYRMAHGDVS